MRAAIGLLVIASSLACSSVPSVASRAPNVAPSAAGASPTLTTRPTLPPAVPALTPLAVPLPVAPLPTATPISTPDTPRVPMSPMTVTERVLAPKVPYVASGRATSGAYPERPLIPIWSGLDCSQYPSVSRDGRFVAYGSVRERARNARPAPVDDVKDGDVVVPTVRLMDLVTGADRELGAGMCDPVWSALNWLAFVQGAADAGTVGAPYPGRIVVRENVNGPVEVWSDPGEYVGLRWAGRRVLAYRLARWPSGTRSWELVVVDGPGKMRSFGLDVNLIAVAADGDRIVITTTPADPYAGWATVRVVQLSDGRELASLPLTSIANLGPGGTWRGTSVVTKLGIYPGGSTHPGPEFIVLDVGPRSITVRGVFWLAAPSLVGPGPFAALVSPHFVDDTHVGASFGWFVDRYLECDLSRLECLVSPALEGGYQLMTR